MARQADRALADSVREHDAALGGLIRANPLAILVVDADDCVQMVNPAFEALFGYCEDELVGQPIDVFIVPRELATEAAALSRSGFEGRTARSMTQRRRKDGSLVDVELTVVPLATTRRAIGAYGIFRDMTEQKRAERHLRAQYAVIEALANSSSIEVAASSVLRAVAESVHWQVGAMWLVDKTANRLRCIDFWCADGVGAGAFERQTRESQFARGVGPGRTWEMRDAAWMVDVTREPKFSRRESAAAAGLHAAFSFPMLLDGDVVGVVEFFTSMVLQPDPAILKMFAALGQQLGEFVGRTRAQEQLEQFFTMSADLLCIANFDGYFARVNSSWSRLLGFTTTELLSQPYIEFVHYEDREATVVVAAALQRGEPLTSFENRFRCKDGTYRWLQWTATSRPDEQLIYAVAHDTTDRKLLEYQTQETLKMRNDFVSFVTHQLRTPLSGIKWMLELATETSDAAETASYMEDARESADRLIGLVNDLLDASRLESGKLQLALEPVHVGELTDAVLADVTTLVRDKHHIVDVRSETDVPMAVLDRQLMRQVILNLISNAIKYTPAGGRIDIRMGARGRSVYWSIRDSGIGISPEAQKRLFEKFFRADNAHTVDTEGTGLGLYLVRLIIERLGGTITCESDEGRGTLFSFTLPTTAGDLI
ncbi:MAG TPA: PAS domain S-box protein [Vicinamibacterales bacterium]|nr:PAS domain S-box protein [Vicinamibacterales bacterium]